MAVYEYRPRNFGTTPTPAFLVPPNAGSPAALVGGETALDTSDGYTSWTRLRAVGSGLLGAPSSFEGHVFTFEPVGAAAPTEGITRVWWEMDYQHDAKAVDPATGVTANTVLMWGHNGSGYMQVFGAGGEDFHPFGDVESQDLFAGFFPYLPAILAGTFILGAGDGGHLDTVTVDVTRLTMYVEAAATRQALRQLHRDDGYGTTPPRAFGGASRNRTRRAYGYD